MRILKKDLRRGILTLKVDNAFDLWVLYHVISPGDVVSSWTLRTVKIGTKEEKKKVFLKLNAESLDFKKGVGRLRVTGRIIEGKPEEFVQLSRFHSFDIKEGDTLTVEKREWRQHELERLEEAVKLSRTREASILVVDDKRILLAYLLPYEVEFAGEWEVFLSKKQGGGIDRKQIQKLADLIKDKPLIVTGIEAFAREVLEVLESYGVKGRYVPAPSSDESAVRYLIESGILSQIVGELKLKKESEKMAEFEKHLYKGDGLVAYGKEEIKKASESYAVEELLVLPSLLNDEEWRKIFKAVEEGGGRIIFFNPESEYGKKLEGYGGAVAILRFRT